jgi:ubiquinone/menaquinone biosynthesis C-methylase UbiE
MCPLLSTYSRREIHEEWESIYRSSKLQDRFNDLMMDRILSFLKLAPGAVVLDAGCGSGHHSIRIASRDFQAVAVDISAANLLKARKNVAERGLSSRVTFAREALESLSFRDGSFDAVYCRGVLMHIPHWKKALHNLQRVLKPGGRMALLESNDGSLEAGLVLCLRRFLARESKVVRSREGLEFWSEKGGTPFLARMVNIRFLRDFLKANQERTIHHSADEFWDLNRFPPGLLRNAAILFNRLWFTLRLPASLSAGNIIIGEKVGSAARSRARSPQGPEPPVAAAAASPTPQPAGQSR